MTSREEQLAALSDIRSMMERSSRFISLSGLSGIFAGVTALIGAYLAYLRLSQMGAIAADSPLGSYTASQNNILDLMLIAMGVLIIALAFAIFFTTRNAKKKGQKIWGPVSKRLISSMLWPLGIGGIFCLLLIKNGAVTLVAPATLVFYGLALINSSKYTLHDIWYLGISEALLGLIACYFVGYGLLFWAIGFGLLHIIYGTLMYVKYEAKSDTLNRTNT